MMKGNQMSAGGRIAASLREKQDQRAAWRVCLLFLLRFFLSCLLVFAVGKVVFMCYNHSVEAFSVRDVWDVWRHGFSMDVSTSCYLLVLPWLVMLVWQCWRRMPVRWLLVPYSVLVAVLLGLIIGGDAVLYEFWKFKLNAAIFSYMH
ncbi:MAG: hypothetical protein II578_05785, partial [Bacteroidaceae bacterium]|nr:hypothetical protein [Bacteroidaceae bacterium]